MNVSHSSRSQGKQILAARKIVTKFHSVPSKCMVKLQSTERHSTLQFGFSDFISKGLPAACFKQTQLSRVKYNHYARWARENVPPDRLSVTSQPDPTRRLNTCLLRIPDRTHSTRSFSAHHSRRLPPRFSASGPDPRDPRSTDQGDQPPDPLGSSPPARMVAVADATSSSPPPPASAATPRRCSRRRHPGPRRRSTRARGTAGRAVGSNGAASAQAEEGSSMTTGGECVSVRPLGRDWVPSFVTERGADQSLLYAALDRSVVR
jgi:hypothetical protein